MKSTKAFSIAVSIATAALYIRGSGVMAQQPDGALQQRRPVQTGTSGSQGVLSGLNLGPLMMAFGGAGGIMTDFTRSNERILLQRSDVRSELFIDSKQREKLAELDQQAQQQLERTMLATVIQNTVNNPELKELAQHSKDGKPDPEALAEVLNSCFGKMQDGVHASQADIDIKENALLYPSQRKRLHELDLQWRGMLALTDKSVASELKATPEQTTGAEAALKAYQTTQMSVLQPVMSQYVTYNQQAAGSNRAPRTFDPQLTQRALSAAMDSDAMRQARSKAESKVKAQLTSEQKELWQSMTGKRFYFARLDQ